LNIIAENPEMQAQLVSSHGMLAVLEVLEGRCSNIVIEKLLQIINLVRYVIRLFSSVLGSSGFCKLVTEDIGFLESFCLIGYVLVLGRTFW
jgi:hypothetical protein